MPSSPKRALGLKVALLLFILAVVTAACATSRAPIDPRFLAVHNAFSAMGMAQVGPVQQGSLAEGREARLSVDLGAGCTTLVAMGGDGVRDLDLVLLDAQGNPLARDTSHDPQAVLRACVDAAGSYALVVRMAAGAGEFLAATWSGGGTAGPAGSAAVAASGRGTCDSPIAIAPGTINGNTTNGESENRGQCVNSQGREIVYRLELPSTKKLTIEVKARFDAVLYVRKEVCDSDDEEYEVKCNDDDGDEHSSRIDAVVEAGTYYVFVDGYDDPGSFVMNVSATDVPSLADVCRQARPLTTSSTASGTTTSSYDHVHASCGDGAKGSDVPYRFDLGQRSRVRFTHTSSEFAPIVHVRSVCTDEQTEVACYDSSSATQDDQAVFVGVLDPGAYAVIADGSDEDSTGRYTLDAEVAPETGSGTTGDACADAVALPPNDASIDGDTFTAKDDVAGKCGGTGAADVVYRVDVPKRSRIIARFDREEGVAPDGNGDAHIFFLQRTCGDKNSEIACGSSVDEILQPGTYFLSVDGAKPDRFGKFTIDWSVKDVSGQENACKNAPTLTDGQTVSASTSGAGDKFVTSCGGERLGASPDKIYKIVLGSRQRVRLALSTPNWDGALAIRKACLDPAGSTSARQAEVACNNDAEDVHHARLETMLDAGTYFVVVDGHRGAQEGAFTLEYRIVK
jgi:hypothetical protein